MAVQSTSSDTEFIFNFSFQPSTRIEIEFCVAFLTLFYELSLSLQSCIVIYSLCVCVLSSPETKISIEFYQFQKEYPTKKATDEWNKSNFKKKVFYFRFAAGNSFIHSFICVNAIQKSRRWRLLFTLCIVYSVVDWNALVCDSDSCVLLHI